MSIIGEIERAEKYKQRSRFNRNMEIVGGSQCKYIVVMRMDLNLRVKGRRWLPLVDF